MWVELLVPQVCIVLYGDSAAGGGEDEELPFFFVKVWEFK